MKTLKQHLQETDLKIFQPQKDTDKPNWITFKTIEAVKEWLLENLDDLTERYCYTGMTSPEFYSRANEIKKLIEELEQ